jgi:hypothetical protein
VTDPTDRNLSPHTTAETPVSPAWSTFGQHRFRTPVGIVIDTPIPMTDGWLAALWPDPTERGGWRRLIWEPDTSTGRGWLIPERLGYADVVEFGSDPTGTQRWYGIVARYEPGQWLTLQGPFPTPSDAYVAAGRLLAPEQHIAQQHRGEQPRAHRERCRHPRNRIR